MDRVRGVEIADTLYRAPLRRGKSQDLATQFSVGRALSVLSGIAYAPRP